MKIINLKDESIQKNEIEQVQLQKQEYNILGTFIKTRGLTLYYLNPTNNSIGILEIYKKDVIELAKIKGKLIPIDIPHDKVNIDSRFIPFETLNLKTAQQRVDKWKQGKIKELNNLRKPTKISFY